MLRGWRHLRLYLRLALVGALLLAVTIVALMLYTTRAQQQVLTADLEHRVSIMGHNLSMAAAPLILRQDTQALEELLRWAVGSPELEALRILDGEGRTLAYVRERTDGETEVATDSAARPPPAWLAGQSTPRVLRQGSHWQLWYPLGTVGTSGWIGIDISLASWTSLRNRVLRENLVAASVAIVVEVLSLFLILSVPARGFRRAVEFARRLTERPGEQLSLSGASREIDELLAALNVSSTKLGEQRAQLGTNERALRDLTASLEQRVRERTRQLRASRHHLRLLDQAVEQSAAAVIVTDHNKRIIYVNSGFTAITGYSREEAIGRTPAILRSDRNPPSLFAELREHLAAGDTWQGELINRKKNGAQFWQQSTISPVKNRMGRVTHYVSVQEDVTERKHYEEQLLRQAHFDHLTGLPNRVLGMDRLRQTLAHGARVGRRTIIMFLDLDQFKSVNDTLGHRFGDRLLVETAERLRGCIRREDTVARLGGDEFLLILADVKEPSVADVLADKIGRTLAQPYLIDTRELYVGVSIGITVAPDDSVDPEILLRNADTAMYRAKRAGRNRYQYYAESMNEEALWRLQLESELHSALARKELSLLFQPILDLRAGRIVAAEALLRWHSSVLGEVPPDVFIPVAEESGLIVPIGEWVLREACQIAAEWPESSRCAVSVNLSRVQFKEIGSLSMLPDILEKTGLPSKRLHLELTERILMEEVDEVETAIRTLHELGVVLSIDDFGTGYSSLSYLKRFPCPIIKIDKSFIRDIDGDPDDAALVDAVIHMGHSLSRRVVAEGVETKQQLRFLRDRGCDCVQGFLFSRPVPVAEFERLLRHGDLLAKGDEARQTA